MLHLPVTATAQREVRANGLWRLGPLSGRHSWALTAPDAAVVSQLGPAHMQTWAQSDLAPWATIAMIRATDRLLLPLHPDQPVVVSLGAHPRAEPFSTSSEPVWDLLVTAGRLEAITEHDAETLTVGKWQDPLLGVAGAYALLGRGREDYLTTVLGNRDILEPNIPDVAVLRDVLNHRTGQRDDDRTLDLLREHAQAQAIPVFRWGVPLAIAAAHRHGLHDWLPMLLHADDTLVPTSIWTMWTAD